MKDEDLRRLFKRNPPELPVERGFQREVWQKIGRRNEILSLPFLLKTTGDFLTRPALGIPLAVAAVACSAWLAVHNGVESRNETWNELALSYNQIINPINHDN
ncbi:MAG: hypothetical protein P1V20_03415 [Verrucomicrobiales bacterium]|nr:hypothetical protein [Verrucomicrobiales bacterium]